MIVWFRYSLVVTVLHRLESSRKVWVKAGHLWREGSKGKGRAREVTG